MDVVQVEARVQRRMTPCRVIGCIARNGEAHFVQLPEHLRLRPVGDADLPLLLAIYCSTREAELEHVAWPSAVKREFLKGQFETQHRCYQTRFPTAGFYVIQQQELDIGRLYLDWHERELRLIDIALLPAWRNQGIGSSILRSLLITTDMLGQEVFLHVEANNPALSLYRRMGFETFVDRGVYLELCRRPQRRAASESAAMNPMPAANVFHLVRNPRVNGATQ